MHTFFILPVIGFLTGIMTCSAPVKESGTASQPDLPYRIMFYNTENFFDTVDDTLTEDDYFTPAGKLHWTRKRYDAKLGNLYKVIVATGIRQPPDIIGLCEVENRQVLLDIIEETPLNRYDYAVLHENSADRRGIDVALLFNTQTVRHLESKHYSIGLPGLYTRDVLYFKALLGEDTCHFLVNHWPSRSEGQLESEYKRLAAATRVRQITDSLLSCQPSASIVLMGDFNDDPTDKSIAQVLGAQSVWREPFPKELYNLTTRPARGAVRGTLKFRGYWNLFDQIIVSGNLVITKKGLRAAKGSYRIFDEPYLLMEDPEFSGYKPFRTYDGFTYLGGFSDHLPVFIDVAVQ
jgi:predicted extracellular nuclease